MGNWSTHPAQIFSYIIQLAFVSTASSTKDTSLKPFPSNPPHCKFKWSPPAFGGVSKDINFSPDSYKTSSLTHLRDLLGAGTKFDWPSSFVDSKLVCIILVLAFPAPLTAVKLCSALYFRLRGQRPSMTRNGDELVTNSRKEGNRNKQQRGLY